MFCSGTHVAPNTGVVGVCSTSGSNGEYTPSTPGALLAAVVSMASISPWAIVLPTTEPYTMPGKVWSSA